MKQFIVLLAVLPLMLVFFVQFSVDQINSSKISLLCDIVYAAKEEAKQEGCFTEEIVADMKSDIAAALKIPEGDIIVEATDSVKYRVIDASAYGGSEWERGLIYYKVSVPIGKAMAGGKLFGIKDSENRYVYTIESYAASERLP